MRTKTDTHTYAIISASGSQIRVEEGQEIDLFRLPDKEVGATIEFPDVLLLNTDGVVTVGAPTIAGASVSGTVTRVFKGEKIRVATYKAKSRLRRVKSHRDQLTRVKIERIVTKKERNKLPLETKTQ